MIQQDLCTRNKEKEEIKVIHSFYRYKLNINVRKVLSKLTTGAV
jgi:hypothetical protein